MRHSTISREVHRNRLRESQYLPEVAQSRALNRRHHAVKYRLCEMTIAFVEFALSLKWSPEQIACVGKSAGYAVSHEWIYEQSLTIRLWTLNAQSMPDQESVWDISSLLLCLMNYVKQLNLVSGALWS